MRTEQDRTDLSRYVTKSFRTGVQRNSYLTTTCTEKVRANGRGKSSRKACAKTPSRSARTRGRKNNGYVGWLFGLFIPHSLSLSFLTGHPGHLTFPACFFRLARYMAKVCSEVFNSQKFDEFFKNSPDFSTIVLNMPVICFKKIYRHIWLVAKSG